MENTVSVVLNSWKSVYECLLENSFIVLSHEHDVIMFIGKLISLSINDI